MAIYWNAARVRRHMAKQKVGTAAELARFARITKPTAGRILAGGQIDRIDAGILESLAVAFQLEPGAFLRYEAPTPGIVYDLD